MRNALVEKSTEHQAFDRPDKRRVGIADRESGSSYLKGQTTMKVGKRTWESRLQISVLIVTAKVDAMLFVIDPAFVLLSCTSDRKARL